MGNILITADQHLNDYVHRNPSPKYRLLQSRIVAQNIIEAQKKYNIDTIFFAGDLIHKSVVRPYVLSEVKLFLDTVMSHFKTGRIIYGNHDLDTKLPDQDPEDCVLSVLLPPNLKYADRKVEKFGNSTIAFSNWRPGTIGLDWVPGHVDYLITHATIAYSPGDFFSSTSIDESKFDMCFSGDIHKPAQKGKFVSVGIPQRCTLGDSPQCTGIVLDPVNKKWMYIDLNPSDNLLKFDTVKDQAYEGYRADNNTWYVYKPDAIVSSDPGSTLTPQLWGEVDSLISTVITTEGLQGIHAEVLKRLPADYEELDLGFVLTGFRCKNWRSIDNLDMKLGPGDRIVLHGQNGAGKSSILSALKSALIEAPRGLKSFVCNKTGAKNCWAEVDFLYQSHQYTLRRGTGTDNSGKCWGLWIDGIQQPYPNVTSFNQDVASRFPFLSVLEYFYFDDNHARFLGDMKNEEKPILIAKLLKLGRIDVYNEVASEILGELTKANEAYTYKKVDLTGQLERLSSQKASLRVPTKSLETLERERQEGYEVQRKANAFLAYQMSLTEKTQKLEILKKDLSETDAELAGLTFTLASLDTSVSEATEKLRGLRESESKITRSAGELIELQRQLTEINSEGTKVYTEYQGLKPDTCPTCGQQVGTEIFEKYKGELEGRLTTLTERQATVRAQIDSCTYDQSGLAKVREEISSTEAILQGLYSQRATYTGLIGKRERLVAEIEKESAAGSVKVDVPEKVILPENALQIMSSIESDISAWTRITDISSEEARLTAELQTITAELSKSAGATQDLNRYIGITGPTGEIYTAVMTRVAAEFSDNHVYYEPLKFTFRRKDHLDLVSYFIGPDGKKIMYDSASSGQKTMMDLHIMSRLTEGLGLVVYDEFLKSLDPGNHDEMLGMIKDMKVGTVLLVSHQEGISGFQNKTMELELGPDGLTKVQFV